ncbi:MAG: hypothetical protein R3266_07285, partial [Gemmatimonadota bacterium]|nr:hypothetical protein [Gemmatimonadota bacterium]
SGWRWAAVGLAAAVVAIAILPGRRVPVAPPAAVTMDTRPPAPAPAFAVEATSAARFAVFQTRNPRMRVVWLYGSRPAPERE